jgi:hypothetical protein
MESAKGRSRQFCRQAIDFFVAGDGTAGFNGFGKSNRREQVSMSWAGLSPLSCSLISSSRHGRKNRRTDNRGQRRFVSSPEQLEARWALSGDPIVTVDTNYGDFQIELFPAAAPQTVANFLSYVTSGAYTDSIFHRSEQPSALNPNDIGIIQSGGFTSASTTYTSVSQF